MTIVIKLVAHDAVTDIDALRLELNADTGIGATCSSIRLTPESAPDTDELRFDFDGVPDDATLDAVIAATPITAPSVPATLAVTSNTWEPVVSFSVQEGTSATFDLKLIGSIGDAASIRAINLSSSGTCERPTGGPLRAELPFSFGLNGRLRLRVSTSGSIVTLEVRSRSTGTITFSDESRFTLIQVEPS